MSDDLRSTLESAVVESENEVAPAPVQIESPVPDASPAADAPSADAPAGNSESQTTDTPSSDAPPSIEKVVGDASKVADDKQEVAARVDRAPASWKGESKKVWDTLPLHVRQEVIRRERDTTKVLNESAQVRQSFTQVQEVLAPHMSRINEIYGGNAVQAINNLMGVERTLSTGDAVSKAQLVANMINHFKVDLRTLDALLVGKDAPAEVSQQSSLERLLEQKLAPVQQFIQTQQQRDAQRTQQAEQEVLHTVESMATDPQYPYFNEVRNDMADLIDISAKKGLYLSLPDAYNKAVRMNDDVFAASSTRDTSQTATQAALQAHQEAQRAKGASQSVSGSPSGVGPNKGNPSDLRGTILSAYGETGRL